MRSSGDEVVIIGAGPYGLSAAAHLKAAGLEPHVFGQSMDFWKNHMPASMLLRSKMEASNIDAPAGYLTIADFKRSTGRKLSDPLPIEDFIAYGDWFQRQVIPRLDTRQVRNVSRDEQSFHITLEDGEVVRARFVVLALGIGYFLARPHEFAEIPVELAPHSSQLADLTRFRDRRVVVIGSGQSALEYSALLHENGANVLILTRAPKLTFRPFAWRKHLFRQLTPGPLKPLSYAVFPPTDLGNIKTVRIMAHPEKFIAQAPEVQAQLLKDCAKPIGAYWLPARLRGVETKTGVSVRNAEIAPDGVKLSLSDGTTLRANEVVLATGYKINISRYNIIDKALSGLIQTSDGYPILAKSLETSVEGLYMTGVVAERTLGPTLRFVTGTNNAGPRLAAGIAARAALPRTSMNVAEIPDEVLS
ncbi:MAG: FAD-dependent oxidoreductase [Candidatus Acidiferrum sp.]